MNKDNKGQAYQQLKGCRRKGSQKKEVSQKSGEGSVSDKYDQTCPGLQKVRSKQALKIRKPVVTFSQAAAGPLLGSVNWYNYFRRYFSIRQESEDVKM